MITEEVSGVAFVAVATAVGGGVVVEEGGGHYDLDFCEGRPEERLRWVTDSRT